MNAITSLRFRRRRFITGPRSFLLDLATAGAKRLPRHPRPVNGISPLTKGSRPYCFLLRRRVDGMFDFRPRPCRVDYHGQAARGRVGLSPWATALLPA